MASITIARPNKKFKSKSRENSYYIKVDGERVMLDPSDVEAWDTIIDMTIGDAEYTQRTATEADMDKGFLKVGTKDAAEVGDQIEDKWTRKEVLDYTTTTRDFVVAEHQAKLAQLAKVSIGNVALTDSKVAAIGAAI